MKKVAEPRLEIRRLAQRDCRDAGQFIAATMTWTWENFGRSAVTARGLARWIALRRRSLIPGLKDPDQYCFLAVHGKNILGIALGETGFGVGSLDWLAVDPNHQGRGIGKTLMEAVERHMLKKRCHKMTLYTYAVLVPAISLYLNSGMIPEAYLRKHALGEDYVVMSKWLGKV